MRAAFRLVQAVQAWIGGFVAFLITSDRLADFAFVAGHVQNIIGDLERQPDMPP